MAQKTCEDCRYYRLIGEDEEYTNVDLSIDIEAGTEECLVEPKPTYIWAERPACRYFKAILPEFMRVKRGVK